MTSGALAKLLIYAPCSKCQLPVWLPHSDLTDASYQSSRATLYIIKIKLEDWGGGIHNSGRVGPFSPEVNRITVGVEVDKVQAIGIHQQKALMVVDFLCFILLLVAISNTKKLVMGSWEIIAMWVDELHWGKKRKIWTWQLHMYKQNI